MRRFHERDVRRFYDLLQHGAKSGLTQINVMDEDHLIGVGLFDNEDDFAAECRRYNTLGLLQAGVNPRSAQLLDEYGGLQNRIRTLFSDIVSKRDIACVTAVVISEPGQLTEPALAYQKDVSVLGDGALFFPLDGEISIEKDRPNRTAKQIADVLGRGDLVRHRSHPHGSRTRHSRSRGHLFPPPPAISQVPPVHFGRHIRGDSRGIGEPRSAPSSIF